MKDPIERQAAIDEIKALYEWHDTVTEDRTIDHLKRLPSVEPDVPATNVGKWIPHPEFQEYDVCSACGLGCKRREYGVTDGNEWMSEWNYRFCPNCGAKMEVQND